MPRPQQKTWIEISESALVHNFRVLKKQAAPAQPMAIIKANAYGHGIQEVATLLKKEADWFGVDSIEEAFQLKKINVKQQILVLGYVPLARIKEAVDHGIHLTVSTAVTIQEIGQHATKKKPAHIHLKIDTGLVRQGIQPKTLPTFIRLLKTFPCLHVEGVATHFANIEETGQTGFAKKQLAAFQEAIKTLEKAGFNPPWKHAACSAAILTAPEAHLTLVRLGIGLYGLWSSKRTQRDAPRDTQLKPVFTWKTIIAQTKEVPAGTAIGYGLTERVKQKTRVAVIPVGYADGFDRKQSNKGQVLIQGKRCKILGRICMNMCMVDISHLSQIREEEEVVLMGKQGTEEISAEKIAQKCHTIHYEIVSRLSPLILRKRVK